MVDTSPRRMTRLTMLMLGVVCAVFPVYVASSEQQDDSQPQEQAIEPETALEPAIIATLTMNLDSGDGTFEATATVSEGEDASLAAFRFGEEFGLKEPKQLLDLIEKLDSKLEEAKYSPPQEITHCGKRVCTAGKLRKRAEDNRKVDLYDGMGADLLRALQKKGLEEQIRARLVRELSSAFQGVGRQRQREHEEVLHQIELDERRKRMEEAMEESRQRKLLDDEDWTLFEQGRAESEDDDSESTSEEATEADREVIASVSLTISSGDNKDEDGKKVSATAILHEDEDAIEASHRFCVENGIHNHNEVLKIANLLKTQAGEQYSPAKVEENCEELVARGKKYANSGRFSDAGVTYARALHIGESFSEEEHIEKLHKVSEGLQTVMQSQANTQRVIELFQLHNYTAVLDEFTETPYMLRNNSLRLIKARSNQQLGNTANVIIDAATVIERSASYSRWKRGQPRMMAVTLGANAAMEIGSEKKALKFYQTVLKYDPDQKQVRAQYRGLKKVTKLLKQADEQLEKGYNNQAMKLIDECLGAVRGLDVDSPVFRSNIQLKLCSVQSKLRKHEEALENCDAVVTLREKAAEVSGMFLDPKYLAEAYLKRADALMEDDDYDEAVGDFQSALQHMSEHNQHEVRGRLQEAQHKRDEWNGGQKDHYHNEHNGFPEGKPPQRDNVKIMGLPVNLAESSEEVRCKWLKKMYKKMALKWHPDKYKGNKKRGSRKMREINDAKELLAKDWGCKMRGGRGGR